MCVCVRVLSHCSRGSFPILSSDPFRKALKNPRIKRLLKRTMLEQNGESTARIAMEKRRNTESAFPLELPGPRPVDTSETVARSSRPAQHHLVFKGVIFLSVAGLGNLKVFLPIYLNYSQAQVSTGSPKMGELLQRLRGWALPGCCVPILRRDRRGVVRPGRLQATRFAVLCMGCQGNVAPSRCMGIFLPPP